MASSDPITAADDLLHGWKAIGDYLGMRPDAARHLARTAGLPIFRLPGNKTIRARRSVLDKYFSIHETKRLEGVRNG